MHTKQKFNRRTFLSAAALMGTGLVFGPSVFAQSGGRPLKIGMITSLSGPFAALGASMRTGLQLLIAESGGAMAVRRLLLRGRQHRVSRGKRYHEAADQQHVQLLARGVARANAQAGDIDTDEQQEGDPRPGHGAHSELLAHQAIRAEYSPRREQHRRNEQEIDAPPAHAPP